MTSYFDDYRYDFRVTWEDTDGTPHETVFLTAAEARAFVDGLAAGDDGVKFLTVDTALVIKERKAKA